MRKPKFRVGQVVALWRDTGIPRGSAVPVFYRIKATFLDHTGEIRYNFEARGGDTNAAVLCPVESLLTALTASEIGLRSNPKPVPQGRK